MVYQGSKRRLAKHIKPIIEGYLQEGMIYVEPFVGGANMIDKIEWPVKYGFDFSKSLIALHIKNQQEELPELLPVREIYNEIKHNQDKYEPWIVGYYGYLMSFRAQGFSGGFAAGYNGRNYAKDRLVNLTKQRLNEQYQNIIFGVADYKDLIISNAVIYLDPPYINTKQYGDKFNHEELWKKCEEWSKCNNIILLSELEAPSDKWDILLEIEHKHTLSDGKHKPRQVTEKLFIWKK